MTLVPLTGPGLIFPYYHFGPGGTTAFQTNTAIDLTGEKLSLQGRVFIDGRPSGAKTISSAGGKIHFPSATVVFANAGSTLDIGIQDVDPAAGPAARPDGAFDVKATYVGGTDTINSNAWITVAMETGTKNITHGDYVCVVLDFVARAGSDSIVTNTYQKSVPSNPSVNQFIGASWTMSNGNSAPIAVIEFDDGTLATFDGMLPFSTLTEETFGDGTNPDERGLIFQVPWDCKIDALWMAYGTSFNAVVDTVVKLYSTPLGTPSAMFTTTLLGEIYGFTRNEVLNLPTEIALSKNTDYCLAIKSNSANGTRLTTPTFADANYRKFISNGTNLSKGHRDGDTGAFTPTTTAIPLMGVRISQFDDGTGAGAAAGGGSVFAAQGGVIR